MSYRLQYAEKAVRQVEHLPAEFLIEFEENLHFLAFAPSFFSIPIASPPFPPRGQLFHFTIDGASDSKWFFTVIFYYSLDETALHVISVTWRELAED